SAEQRPTVTTAGSAARATDSVTGTVGLVAEQVDVQEVHTNATPAGAARAASATVATTTTVATNAEQRHHGASRQQLHVLAVDLNDAQNVRHQILLGKEVPSDFLGQEHFIGGHTDSAPHTLPHRAHKTISTLHLSR